MNEDYKRKMYDITLYFHHETQQGYADKGAIKVSHDGDDGAAVWLPKEAIEWQMKGPNTVHVTAPESLLIEKGLV